MTEEKIDMELVEKIFILFFMKTFTIPELVVKFKLDDDHEIKKAIGYLERQGKINIYEFENIYHEQCGEISIAIYGISEDDKYT